MFFVAMYLSPFGHGVHNKFNMDAEVGFPAWFTQTMLFSAAALATSIGYARRKLRDHHARAWLAMGVVLLYLCIDEAVGLHELLAEPLRQTLHIQDGPLFFAWIIPAAFVVFLVSLFFLRFFLSLPVKTRLLLGAAAVTYVGGALGMEIVSGLYWSSQDFAFDETYRLLTAIEEGLENTGVTLAIVALVEVWQQQKTKPKLKSVKRSAKPRSRSASQSHTRLRTK
jgi:hypothetical protein